MAGKTKCFAKSGDCVVKHGPNFVTGLGMVVYRQELNYSWEPTCVCVCVCVCVCREPSVISVRHGSAMGGSA